jgi:3-methyladenine DNA glycosylase AlkD
MNLFEKVPFAWDKIREWSRREEEYVKRTAFALLACLAWHSKEAEDVQFVELLTLIEEGSKDERPMVRKAVSWALRSIGKRNRALNRKGIALACKLERADAKSSKRISREALKELTSEKIQARLKK